MRDEINQPLYIKLLLEERAPNNVFEYIQNGILVTDRNSRIVYVNPAFTRISGYSSKEILGSKPGMLHSGRHDKAFYESMWASIQKKGFWEGEVWNRRKSGVIYPEFLTISSLSDLTGHISYYVGVFSDIYDLKIEMYKKLKLAFYDPLTELPNRILYHDRLENTLKDSGKEPRPCHAIFFMDLDKFKAVNDTFGHLAGDKLLREVGQRLSTVIRAGDTVARVGGDEFTAMLNNVKDKAYVEEVAKRMVDAVEKPFKIDGVEVKPDISIGISLYPYDATGTDELISLADKAMYNAKIHHSKIQYYGKCNQVNN